MLPATRVSLLPRLASVACCLLIGLQIQRLVDAAMVSRSSSSRSGW